MSAVMIRLSDEGEANADDDGCRILFALVRDCAYRIRAEARRELERHAAAASRTLN